MVERATPCFSALVRHRGGEMVHAKIHHLPSPSGVALSTVIPGGKAIELMGSPDLMTLPGNAETAGMVAIGTFSLGWTSGRGHRFAEQFIGWDLCRTEYDI